jgi:hypothetical protein
MAITNFENGGGQVHKTGHGTTVDKIVRPAQDVNRWFASPCVKDIDQNCEQNRLSHFPSIDLAGSREVPRLPDWPSISATL